MVRVTCAQKCRRAKGNGRGAAGFAVACGGLEEDDRVSGDTRQRSMEMRLPLKKLNECQDLAAISAS